MRSMALLKGLPTSLIWPAQFARAEGDRAAQPMAQPRPSIAPALMCYGRSAALWGRCRRPFHAPRLGKGFTSQPGWTLGSAALRHSLVAGPCLSARLQGGSCVTPPVAAAESHRASLSFPSDNGKTGPIAVSSTSPAAPAPPAAPWLAIRAATPRRASTPRCIGIGSAAARAAFRQRLSFAR
jgi:hypothetical protein